MKADIKITKIIIKGSALEAKKEDLETIRQAIKEKFNVEHRENIIMVYDSLHKE